MLPIKKFKEKFKEIIKEEDEFFDPIIFDTPLSTSRFIGERYEFIVDGNKHSGLMIGELDETLFDYFKKYIYSSEFYHSHEVSLREGNIYLMNEKEREELFDEKTSKDFFFARSNCD